MYVMRLNFNLDAFNYDNRAAETSQQRQARLEQNRTGNAESRAAETPQQRQARLEQNRTGNAESRAAETPQQRQARLEQNFSNSFIFYRIPSNAGYFSQYILKRTWRCALD
jgi:uncharacterized membrane-anchored protein